MKKEQLRDCYQLWKNCFGDSDLYMDYYFREKVRDNQILTLYEGEKLTSMIHLNPYQISLDENLVTANYIVGVATDQAYRKQGRMRILLKDAFAKMYEEGQGFTYLMPADEKIYTPFDFRFIYEQERIQLEGVKGQEDSYELKVAQIKPEIEVNTLEVATEQILNDVVSYVNYKLNQEFTIYTIHSKDYYLRLQKEMKAAGGQVLIFSQQNHIIGVVAFMKEGRIVEVVESVIETEFTQDIIDNLLDGITEGNEDTVDIEFFDTYYLDTQKIKEDFKQVTWKNKPIIMARIINLRRFVETIQVDGVYKRIIKIQDDFIEDNNGVWEFDFSPHGCKVIKTNEPSDCIMTIYEVLQYLLQNKRIYINEIV